MSRCSQGYWPNVPSPPEICQAWTRRSATDCSIGRARAYIVAGIGRIRDRGSKGMRSGAIAGLLEKGGDPNCLTGRRQAWLRWA
jgi:hypothetical protein